MKKTIKINGMNCMHCVKAVKESLGEVKGINKVEVSLENKQAIVNLENEVSNEQIIEAIDDAGFEVIEII